LYDQLEIVNVAALSACTFALPNRLQMSNTLLGFGIVAIAAAIVGGGLKAFGVEFPALQSTARQVLLAILGIISIASAEWNIVQQSTDWIWQKIWPQPQPQPQPQLQRQSAPAPDQKFYYRLSTMFGGPKQPLDVISGGPNNNLTHLAPLQEAPGQFWHFRANNDGTYALTNRLRGANTCLDIFVGGSSDNQPYLTTCSNVSGQAWSLWMDASGIRLTTQFRGPSTCLDIFNGGPDNNQPHLAPCDDVSGQYWVLSKTDKQVN
jgi:Ricin-type beta-trefoil lectin domain